jgi:hypothetical protein
MVLQPLGQIRAERVIEPTDASGLAAKVMRLLELAAERRIDLVVTPEYSCPWSAVLDLLERELVPEPGRLWVLGCAGITLDDLDRVRAERPDVEWIVDEECVPTRQQPPQFVDPVCYIFRATRVAGRESTVVVVQFKGTPMYDPVSRFEARNMARGEQRFVFRNPGDGNAAKLVTVLCSDALGNLDGEEWYENYNAPYLVLHIQLCMDPRDDEFMRGRVEPFRHRAPGIDFVCLNWAHGFAVPQYNWVSRFGGSAYYTKAENADVSDEREAWNHWKGMYYHWCSDHHTHMYALNYDEAVYSWATQKPSQRSVAGVEQQETRTGPEMVACYAWDACSGVWSEVDDIEDGAAALCGCTPELASVGVILRRLAPLDCERFILLSTGGISKPRRSGKWHDVQNMLSTRVDLREISKRLSWVQDPDEESAQWRERTLAKLALLAGLLAARAVQLPECVRDLQDTAHLDYLGATGDREHNAFGAGAPATLVHAGTLLGYHAETLYEHISRALEDDKRLVVFWNSVQGTTEFVVDHVGPLITDSGEDRDTIAREHGG